MRRKKDRSNGITALYERLSRDDDNAGESNSIVHQKQMLEDYAIKHGFTNLVHFTDDGWSGATFDRPSWNRLVEGVKNGEITACICKDMSRIGRDHLQVGFFTDILFREKEVRFIAINNGIDSDRQETSEFAPFLNIMNEWFVRDTSKKIKAVLKSRGSSGNAHTSNIPPYGYLKDPENPDHWIIDEEAAEVVRRIYRMTIEGKGPYQIARELSEEKIERPSYYLGKKGLGNHASNYDKENPYMWRGNQVTTLIARPEYIGKTVNFRTFKNSYKDKKTKRADKEDWVVFDDTQEPIVDEETWLLAQKLRQNVRKADPMGEPNVLTGKIYCADCGAPMYNHRQRKGRERIYYTAKGEKRTSYSNPADCYECSTYNLAYQKYHLDVPWRPSDIEQQEGRILRQGNQNDKVKIFRYVTEGTFDSYSWQLIENKQKFIGQIMTSKSPVRSCEDVDEAALSYAEVKALATGNPYIKEKMDLDIQVSKLKLMKANHTSQKYRLEDNITQHYPHQIAIFKERIEGFTADIEKYAKNKPEDKEQFFMQVGGKPYTDKKEAGTAIIAMCKEIKGINASADVGEYLGFKLNVTFDSFNNKFVMNVKGAMSHALKKLIAAYPDKEVNDRETKEAKIQTIATELDQLSYDIDTFEYRDSVPDREAQVQMIANDIRSGNVKPLQIFLQTSIDEGIDEDSERQAKELIAKLAEYKPLAKIEELEEQNYNMIDDRLNNGVEKFNREEEKKEQAEKPQARSSLKERLVAKQKEVAQGKKDSKEQEKSKNTHREM